MMTVLQQMNVYCPFNDLPRTEANNGVRVTCFHMEVMQVIKLKQC